MKDEKKKGDILDAIFDSLGEVVERVLWILWKIIEVVFLKLISNFKKRYFKESEYEVPLTPRCKEIASEHTRFRNNK